MLTVLSVIVLLRQVIRKVTHSNEVIMQALVVGLVESRVVRRQAEKRGLKLHAEPSMRHRRSQHELSAAHADESATSPEDIAFRGKTM